MDRCARRLITQATRRITTTLKGRLRVSLRDANVSLPVRSNTKLQTDPASSPQASVAVWENMKWRLPSKPARFADLPQFERFDFFPRRGVAGFSM